MLIGIGISPQNQRTVGVAAEDPAEFIVNGGFSADTDWSKGGTWVIAAGVATAPAVGGNLTGTLVQALIPGNSYTLSFTFTAFPAGTGLNVAFSGAVQQNMAAIGASPYSSTFVATSANTTIRFINDNDDPGTLDNVSLVSV